MKSAVVLRHVTQKEVEKRIEKAVSDMGMTRAEVFQRIDAGTLPDTFATVNLKLLRHLLSDTNNQ